MLAKVTFAQGALSEAGIGLGTLQVCFKIFHYSVVTLNLL
jgi:hypothetical protein